jgi:hypothetical protein
MLKIDKNGNRYWYNSAGECHREDGPAAEYTDGTKIWILNGFYHRLDGPAVEGNGGRHIRYYVNGVRIKGNTNVENK